MVGIPGKSKGCHTCRRRKIRCDQQEPNCARCLRSGRECEGYKRGAVFLNRTANGWEKRSRLEEAQPRQPMRPVSNNVPHVAPKVRSVSKESSTPSTPVVWTESQSLVQTTPEKVVSPTTFSPDYKKYVFRTLFLQGYLPKNPKAGTGLAGAWIMEAMKVNDRSASLSYSLDALCLTRVGRVMGHQDLIRRGAATYGLALRNLAASLQSPTLASKDETLAACLILLIYELYESTSNSTTAHEGHMAGIERLVHFRGIEQNDTAWGKALFKNVTYASMVKSLQYRKSSIFKEVVDQTVWWDMQGMLFAKGHQLGALLEDLDTYKNSAQHSMQASAAYLHRCAGLDVEFANWYHDLLAESPSPIYWTSGDQPELNFPDIDSALLLLDYWALRLALSTSIDIICSNVPDQVPPHILAFVDQLRIAHGRARQVELASNIMLSMAYCMEEENGVSSSQKCLFSGRVALFCLRRYNSPQLAKFEQTFMDLQVKKGLRFAQDIQKKEQTGWSSHISEKT